MNLHDAMQANLGFVLKQTTHIEPGVYQIAYPDIDYASLIPVDTSAPEWVKSVTFFSADRAGRARWISGNAKDIPVVGTSREKFETPVYMAGIGYDFGLEEVEQARMIGQPLEAENAAAARRVSEEHIYQVALNGDEEKSFSGLLNYPGIPTDIITSWGPKSADNKLKDVNDLLTGVHTATNTVRMADTLLLPFARFNQIASERLGDTMMTTLEFLRQNNVYTATTGQALTIRGIRGLDNPSGGSPAVARMVAYRRSPEVLKLHLPMPHRFLPVQISGLQFTVPGIFRLGGLDIRLTSEVRYADGL